MRFFFPPTSSFIHIIPFSPDGCACISRKIAFDSYENEKKTRPDALRNRRGANPESRTRKEQGKLSRSGWNGRSVVFSLASEFYLSREEYRFNLVLYKCWHKSAREDLAQ